MKRAVVVGVLALAAIGPSEAWSQPDGAGDTERLGQDVELRAFYHTIKPSPATLRPRLRFQVVDREDGLPQNTVSAIVQDQTGFMWLGTGDGLARYDGRRFLVFRHEPANPASLSDSFVNALLITKDGTLWVGTQGGGVNRYNKDTGSFDRFVASDEPDTLNSGSILSMAEGPAGKIWIGTNGGGLAVLDPGTGAVRSYSMEDGLPPVVSSVLATEDGTVWLGTVAGVYRFRGSGGFELLFQDTPALRNAVISALHRDREGDLWIGTDSSGLARYSPESGDVKTFSADADALDRLNDDSIKAIYQTADGRIWVGTQTAIHSLAPGTDRFEKHLPDAADPQALPRPPVEAIYQDAAGVIWVGTYVGGAAMLDPMSTRFRFYKTVGAGGFSQHGEELWTGTVEGVCRWRGEVNLQGVCYETGWSPNVMVDRSGTAWVATATDGLLSLEPGSTERWIVFQHNPADSKSIEPGFITGLHEDRKGNFWIGLIGGGLQRLDRKKKEFHSYELPSDMVYMMDSDPRQDDILWVATGDRGLLRLHVQTGEIEPFVPDPDNLENRTDNAVVDFVFEGDDVIWMATYGGGLKRLDRKTGAFKSYRRTEGMPSDTLYAILQEPSGKLWLSSVAGLARFDPRTEEVHVFSPADGLQSDEFTQGLRMKGKDGLFYFGGINGFNVFKPEEIEIDRYRPPVVMTAIDILGEPYAKGQRSHTIESLSLDHDEAFAVIDFAALSFSGRDRFQFEYKVEGLNDRWFPTDAASVSLTGLEPGDYTLLLRARNRHGIESEPVKLGIGVAPPPWRTWWAYTGYGLTFIGLLFGTWRYQQQRIERLEKLTRLATVEKEFEVTAAVQSWFLPETDRYSNGQYDLVGFYRAADKCSGDWWWYEDIGGGKLWVIVADVTGHGAGPAMVTAAVAMGLRVQSDTGTEPVIQRLERVSKEVLERCKGKAHMTMTALVLDQQTGEVVIYGLGGLPALQVSQDGRHRVIGASGTPLGSAGNLAVGEKATVLAPGDRLLITTDGVVEAVMANGRQLGLRRFINLMRESRVLPLDHAVHQIMQQVDLSRGTQQQDDDFTFCVIERRGHGSPTAR